MESRLFEYRPGLSPHLRRVANQEREIPMPNISGSFSGTIRTQTLASIPDKPQHTFGLAEVSGTQKTTDPKWDGSSIRYWANTDVVGGEGTQSGYFVNDHGSAGFDHGTFEGKVAMVEGQLVVEGKYQYSGGEGSFAGITGGGTFQTRLTGPTTVEATWEGAYELAGARAHAADA
jgi:hypothetical protein